MTVSYRSVSKSSTNPSRCYSGAHVEPIVDWAYVHEQEDLGVAAGTGSNRQCELNGPKRIEYGHLQKENCTAV